MAKKKVSQLTPATGIGPNDLIMIVQGGISKQALASMLLLPDTVVQVLQLKGGAFKDVGIGGEQVAAGNHGHDNGSIIGGPFTPQGVDNTPVGTTILIPRSSAPDQYIVANGSLLSRSAFPALWAEAQASGNLVNDAAWLAGQYGSYSTGNGTTTFRIPNYCGYGFRAWDLGRGIDAGRVLGSAQNDAIQNITGTLGMDDSTRTQLSGAFYEIGAFNYDANASGGGGYKAGFDASRVVRTAAETRMKNIALLACIKYTSEGQP
jgi:phage-related tail fiber protein